MHYVIQLPHREAPGRYLGRDPYGQFCVPEHKAKRFTTSEAAELFAAQHLNPIAYCVESVPDLMDTAEIASQATAAQSVA